MGKTWPIIMAIYHKPHKKENVDRLIELGTIICHQIEVLWKKPRYRRLVKASSRTRNFFPLLHTNLKETPLSRADQMRASIPLRPAPGYEKGKRGKPPKANPLNRAIHEFILGVKDPKSLTYVAPFYETAKSGLTVTRGPRRRERDIISNATRRKLLSPHGRENLYDWAKGFVTYILEYRSDILSPDYESGKIHGSVAKLREQRRKSQLKNKDAPYEKDGDSANKEAFTQLVFKRLPKFEFLIRTL